MKRVTSLVCGFFLLGLLGGEVQTKGAVKSGSFPQISRFQSRDVES